MPPPAGILAAAVARRGAPPRWQSPKTPYRTGVLP